MTMIERSHFPAQTALPAFSVRVLHLAGRAFKSWKNRRAMYRLSDLSDTELADIGLRRADLHVAFRSPFGIDPTEQLGYIAQARADHAFTGRPD